MDYTASDWKVKLKKALRYTRLYGFKRALIKIQGQYHMKRHYTTLPKMTFPVEKGGHVGLIGCGNFAFSNIAYYLDSTYGHVIRGCMDIDIHKAASLYQKYGLKYYTNDPQKIFSDPDIDLIYIASNHATHAGYAIQALQAGKSVHIEKPHVVTREQLQLLCSAMKDSRGRVCLGFNRPYSRIGQMIKHSLDKQPGALVMNWSIIGHEIPIDHWYSKEEEGGRIFGNLCHWTDFVLQLVPPENRYPLTINPTRGEKSDCDIAVTYTFGDTSIAAITFSAKGYSFEGVRERFSAQRGDTLIFMDDFQTLTIEVAEKKEKKSPFFRDHGHEMCINRSYEMVCPKKNNEYKGCSVDYVFETGNLFLMTKKALESNEPITIHAPTN